MGDIHAQVQDQRIECQADDLDQVKRRKTQDGLVLFLEIELPIQQKTANYTAVKTDDVGIEIGDILAKHRIDGKLQPCADNAEDGIPDKTWMSAIDLFQFHGFLLWECKNTKKNSCNSKKSCTFAVRFEEDNCNY